MSEATISIPDIDRGAFLDLRKELGRDRVTTDGSVGHADTYGELVSTVVIVTLTPIMVRLLAKWLLKHRKLDIAFARKRPDGTEEKLEFHWSTGSEKEQEKGLLDRITDALMEALFGDGDEP